MKLQIKSHSIRFRITAEELQELLVGGRLARETKAPQAGGDIAILKYGVHFSPEIGTSEVEFSPFAINLVLSQPDFAELTDPANEGVYIRREYRGENGKMIRFLAYVEKDKKNKKIKKHKKSKGEKVRKASAESDSDKTQLNQLEVHEL